MSLLSGGWLPAGAQLDRVPALVNEGKVHWVEFGENKLDAPFLSQTLAELRAAERPPRELFTSIETLIRLGDALGDVQPAGFILHVSRCGSTLVANVLKTIPGLRVLSEPHVVTHLLRPCRPSGSRYLDTEWEQLRKLAVRAAIKLLSVDSQGTPRPLVIKFQSPVLLSVQELRECFPQVPCAVLVRDPLEVLVSVVETPTDGWIELRNTPDLALEILGWKDLQRPPDRMLPEEFGARVLGHYFRQAVLAPGQSLTPCPIFDYRDLKEPALREIARLFGFTLSDDLSSVLGRHAKSTPAEALRFQGDVDRKQKAITPMMRTAVNAWAAKDFEEASRRRWRPSTR